MMNTFRGCFCAPFEEQNKAKYVVTFPSYVSQDKEYAFHMVIFETANIKLPVKFEATIVARNSEQDLQISQTFIQTTYGPERHVFAKKDDLGRFESASIRISFNNAPLKRYNDNCGLFPLQNLQDDFIFIQTDKAMYKPLQTVNFRLFVINRQLLPITNGVVEVSISDAKGNKIANWPEAKLQRGIFSESIVLSDFVNFGQWKISAVLLRNNQQVVEKAFQVQQYVLPKYEVKIDFPKGYLVYSEHEEYFGFIIAKYTFGKSIKGKAVITVKHPYGGVILMEQTVVLEGNDCKFSLYGLNEKLGQINNNLKMVCTVKVTEDLTGEVILKDESITLYRNPYTLELIDPPVLKPGLPLQMNFAAKNPDGSPVKDEKFDIALNVTFRSKTNMTKQTTLRTDYAGLASTELVVPHEAKSALIEATLSDFSNVKLSQELTVPFDSDDIILISIDKLTSIPKVGDRVSFSIRTTFDADFVYFIMAQNGDVFLYKKLDRSRMTGKAFCVNVVLPNEAAPRCSALAWTINHGKALADLLELKVDPVVNQHLDASFRPSKVRPGGPVRLAVTASDPNSSVAMFAVDKSVKLLKSGNDITLDDVINGISATGSSDGYEPVSFPLLRKQTRVVARAKLVSYEARPVFKAAGMHIESNMETEQMFSYGWAEDGMHAYRSLGSAVPVNAMLESMPRFGLQQNRETSVGPVVRKVFPETWFWTTVETNSKGEHSQLMKAPDTVTSWIFNAFAIGDHDGFGTLPEPIELTVFQPFFASLDIPYPTVIRNETFAIKAVVFNYQSTENEIELTLKESKQFEISTDGGKNYQSKEVKAEVKVNANDGQSVSLWLKPLELGEITLELEAVSKEGGDVDAVRKVVIVEAQGDVRHANKAMLIQQNEGPTTIDLAEVIESTKVVEGSMLVQLQVVGDVLGPALTNLGNLVRLPTGCGEQTMVILAPNVFIYKYLKAVDKLTPKFEDKAKGFIMSGYQRELTYQRRDGGFSAFGDSDPASSVWLTAFVLRCLNAASKDAETAIDPNVIKAAWRFIATTMVGDGTFKDPGQVLHQGLEGGATGSVKLAAYIYIANAEAAGRNDFIDLSKTRKMLVLQTIDVKDKYQCALLAYAMSILDEDRRLGLSNKLVDALIGDFGDKVETAGYLLLALCNLKRRGDAIKVAQFLISQRNSLGGFSSTQDTVVGVQALSESALLLPRVTDQLNLKIAATLNYTDRSTQSIDFDILPTNAMRLQSFDVPREKCESLRHVQVEATGQGLALFQLAVRYNVTAAGDGAIIDSGDFDIAISESKTQGNATYLEIGIKPKTNETSSGMVVFELGIPTGFEADLETTRQINSDNSKLKMAEIKNRKLIFYFDHVAAVGNKDFNAKLIRDLSKEVRNIQPPLARVYSYYEPKKVKTIAYTFSALAEC